MTCVLPFCCHREKKLHFLCFFWLFCVCNIWGDYNGSNRNIRRKIVLTSRRRFDCHCGRTIRNWNVNRPARLTLTFRWLKKRPLRATLSSFSSIRFRMALTLVCQRVCFFKIITIQANKYLILKHKKSLAYWRTSHIKCGARGLISMNYLYSSKIRVSMFISLNTKSPPRN